MPSFPKPKFPYAYKPQDEIKALRTYRDTEPGRAIPSKANKRLLLATWNVANLGEQKRRPRDYRLLAEIISWFDIIAIQEVKDDILGLRVLQRYLPSSYEALFSDIGGNDERMAYLYDAKKISQLEMVGEIAVPVKDHRHIKLPGVTRKFRGFDRNPYVAAFVAGSLKFVVVNVHLFFGDDNRWDRERRSLEAYATARWADLRHKDKDAYARHIIVLGDFNLPKVEPGDLIYTALRKRGLRRPKHSTSIGSSISTDSHYDQIMFFPGETKKRFTGNTGIFDFDRSIFRRLWETKTQKQFQAYLRYYISDHRPMWAEFRI